MAGVGVGGGFYGVTETHMAPLKARQCTALKNILTKMTPWVAAYGESFPKIGTRNQDILIF